MKGEKVWEDEKISGEWSGKKGGVPTIIPGDNEIVAWVEAQKQDYQAHIKVILRDYVEAHK